MKCVQCGGKTAVLNSRPCANHTYRRRECIDCKHRFSTREMNRDEIEELADAAEQFKKVETAPISEPTPSMHEYQNLLADKVTQFLNSKTASTICEIICQDDCKAKTQKECYRIIHKKMLSVLKEQAE